jgi:hypothetical protein
MLIFFASNEQGISVSVEGVLVSWEMWLFLYQVNEVFLFVSSVISFGLVE